MTHKLTTPADHPPLRTQRQVARDRVLNAFVKGDAYIVIEDWDGGPGFYIPETVENRHTRIDVVTAILEGQYDDGPLMVLGCLYGRAYDASEAVAKDVLRRFLATGMYAEHDLPTFVCEHVDDADEQIAEAKREDEEEAKHREYDRLHAWRG